MASRSKILDWHTQIYKPTFGGFFYRDFLKGGERAAGSLRSRTRFARAAARSAPFKTPLRAGEWRMTQNSTNFCYQVTYVIPPKIFIAFRCIISIQKFKFCNLKKEQLQQ